jgi:uncharacterized protein
VDSREFKNVGALLSFTQVFNPAAGYESVSPYFIGLIQIDDGPRLLAQLTDVRSDVVVTGMRMEAVVRRLKVDGDNGPILYGSKFRPLFMSQESKPEPQ